ncbi:MAG: hypothetical protein CM1200mP40_21120 [Gammaproteobacteria bacterium]|nr:MAG: hypothetical protein CM1200mP40_21120 [Gammaproteobacteria bacterium]
MPVIIEDAFKGVLKNAVHDDTIDQAMVAHLLALPTEGFLIEQAGIAGSMPFIACENRWQITWL